MLFLNFLEYLFLVHIFKIAIADITSMPKLTLATDLIPANSESSPDDRQSTVPSVSATSIARLHIDSGMQSISVPGSY